MAFTLARQKYAWLPSSRHAHFPELLRCGALTMLGQSSRRRLSAAHILQPSLEVCRNILRRRAPSAHGCAACNCGCEVSSKQRHLQRCALLTCCRQICLHPCQLLRLCFGEGQA